MFGSITRAVEAAANVLVVSCNAAEKVAKSADNLASVMEEKSGEYLDTARIKRAKNYATLDAELKALGITSVQPTLLLPK